MTLEEFINKLLEVKTHIGGNALVKMELIGSSVPVSDVTYEGSADELLTLIIK